MRHILVCFLLSTHCLFSADTDTSKLKAVIEKGLVAKEVIDTLTYDDVPERWRARMEDASTEKYVRRAFYRGKDKVLEVSWSKDWVNTKSNMFTATAYDGKKRVANIIRFSGDSTSVSPWRGSQEYMVVTSIKDGGGVTLTIMNDSGYFQGVEVRGRDTRLMDDLEYTKQAISLDQILKPLTDEIDKQLGEAKKKSKRQGK